MLNKRWSSCLDVKIPFARSPTVPSSSSTIHFQPQGQPPYLLHLLHERPPPRIFSWSASQQSNSYMVIIGLSPKSWVVIQKNPSIYNLLDQPAINEVTLSLIYDAIMCWSNVFLHFPSGPWKKWKKCGTIMPRGGSRSHVLIRRVACSFFIFIEPATVQGSLIEGTFSLFPSIACARQNSCNSSFIENPSKVDGQIVTPFHPNALNYCINPWQPRHHCLAHYCEKFSWRERHGSSQGCATHWVAQHLWHHHTQRKHRSWIH